MKNCPCGTNNNYIECCGRYITGSSKADTPEALMRSRYTAYTMANIPYIQLTMRGKPADQYDALTAEIWAKKAKWMGLTVLNSTADNNKGFVEFIARYTYDGQAEDIHEKSEFHKIDDTWYYVDGQLL